MFDTRAYTTYTYVLRGRWELCLSKDFFINLIFENSFIPLTDSGHIFIVKGKTKPHFQELLMLQDGNSQKLWLHLWGKTLCYPVQKIWQQYICWIAIILNSIISFLGLIYVWYTWKYILFFNLKISSIKFSIYLTFNPTYLVLNFFYFYFLWENINCPMLKWLRVYFFSQGVLLVSLCDGGICNTFGVIEMTSRVWCSLIVPARIRKHFKISFN